MVAPLKGLALGIACGFTPSPDTPYALGLGLERGFGLAGRAVGGGVLTDLLLFALYGRTFSCLSGGLPFISLLGAGLLAIFATR